MAPPPPATLPLADRLKALAQTLQYVLLGCLMRPLAAPMLDFSVLTRASLQVWLVRWVCRLERTFDALSPDVGVADNALDT